jgi:diguanylate cyclase (GGDEF)-like protein/PAS domain S-box-containing protein
VTLFLVVVCRYSSACWWWPGDQRRSVVPVAPEDRGLRRTRRLTEVFAWVTAVGALGAVAGAPGSGVARGLLAALILVVLVWWGWGRRAGSWWLVAAEAVVITVGCLVLPSPQPMLGLLFGTTTRRAVRAELGPWLVRAAPAFVGYLCGAFWALVVNGGGVAADRLAPSLLPLLGLVIGTLALGDTVAAVGTAKAAARATAKVNEHLDAVLRTSPVALVVLGSGGVVEMCNDEARALFGWPAGAGHPVPCPHQGDITACRCLELLREAGAGEWTYQNGDGTARTVAVRVSEIPGQDGPGESPNILLAFLDITVRKDLEDRLRAQWEYDDLTGVVSRARLTELVDGALNHSGPDRRPALLLVDLDDFKDINDAYGHPTGDEFLVAAADQLRRTVAGTGVVGRLGGDEFAVLIDADGVDEATRVGERILVALSETAPVAGLMARMRASIGAAVADGQSAQSAAVLLRDADTAMYVAKRAGGNRVQVFHQELRTTLLRRQQDEADLRCALELEQFVLHFQPIVDLCTGEIVGAEALVRWQHPERGVLPPGPVIELAEETGLIVPLGNWVLGAACRQAAEWSSAGFAIRMSVNVSARQLHTEDFVTTVAATLAESGLPPGRLTLELTESALIRPSALALLHDIRALGVRVALDDFGTGYSSLSYLQRHPFDLIKVDRSFVKQLGEVPSAEGIVRCILDLAAVLDTPVVGEGVETRSQAELLAANGCALAQGYYYGKPAPASEWTDLTMNITPFQR